jgi:hypothetical protein
MQAPTWLARRDDPPGPSHRATFRIRCIEDRLDNAIGVERNTANPKKGDTFHERVARMISPPLLRSNGFHGVSKVSLNPRRNSKRS